MKAHLRKPFLMRLWDSYPRVWKHMINVGILLKYKTLKLEKLPDRVQLSSSSTLFVDANENRGRALLISNGMTQKRLSAFWSKAVLHYVPDLVIDVGVNYGECIFSTTYPLHAKIYGVEANSGLFPYIERSKAAHPNGDQMTIVNALASDKGETEVRFFVDKHWSGTSSAATIATHSLVEEVVTESIRVDHLLEEAGVFERLLFKVDVEGYEAFVLKGMTQLFEEQESILGFIEFNSEYIEKTGTSVDEFLLFLRTYFTIYIYEKNDQVINATLLDYEELQTIFGTSYIHTDLILVKGEVTYE